MYTTAGIKDYNELRTQIAHLKAEQLVYEEELKHVFNDFMQSMHPALIIKQTIHELAADKEVNEDLAKTGIEMGKSFLVKKIMNRQPGFKRFVGAALIEIISTVLLNKGVPGIKTMVSKLIHSDSE